MIPEPLVLHGECLEFLRDIPDNTIDAIITDPPYGLSNTDPAHVTEAITQWVSGNREFVPHKRGGFMGKAWDSFVPPPAVWDECLRVLKPGGHVLTFAGTRTMDLMTLGLRLAGFDIRDSLAWLYGSGFPKSLDVSKAIDKAGGASPEVQSRVLSRARKRSGLSREEVAAHVGCTTSSVRDWEEGRARATGRAVEFITPSPAYREALADLLGYTTDERAIVGARLDRRGDGTVIGLGHSGVEYGGPATDAAQQWTGWGTALKPAFEPIVMARKPLTGTVAANVLEHGTGALNIDATRVAASGEKLGGGAEKITTADQKGDEGWTRPWMSDPEAQEAHAGRVRDNVAKAESLGRWPANVILGHTEDCEPVGTRKIKAITGTNSGRGAGTKADESEVYGKYAGRTDMERGAKVGLGDADGMETIEAWNCAPGCPVAELDAQSGTLAAGNHPARRGGDRGDSVYALGHSGTQGSRRPTDTGGASRFFYCAKAPKKERPVIVDEDGTRTVHPTVKPLALMRWLIRLVTPPGGVILDPFVGSGTTIEAGMLEGFEVWGIEGEEDYLPLIQQRVDRVMEAAS